MRDWSSTLATGGRAGRRAEFKWKTKVCEEDILKIQYGRTMPPDEILEKLCSLKFIVFHIALISDRMNLQT